MFDRRVIPCVNGPFHALRPEGGNLPRVVALGLSAGSPSVGPEVTRRICRNLTTPGRRHTVDP
jgi:hypothetical protein